MTNTKDGLKSITPPPNVLPNIVALHRANTDNINHVQGFLRCVEVALSFIKWHSLGVAPDHLTDGEIKATMVFSDEIATACTVVYEHSGKLKPATKKILTKYVDQSINACNRQLKSIGVSKSQPAQLIFDELYKDCPGLKNISYKQAVRELDKRGIKLPPSTASFSRWKNTKGS